MYFYNMIQKNIAEKIKKNNYIIRSFVCMCFCVCVCVYVCVFMWKMTKFPQKEKLDKSSIYSILERKKKEEAKTGLL